MGETKIPDPIMHPMMTVQPFSKVISLFSLISSSFLVLIITQYGNKQGDDCSLSNQNEKNLTCPHEDGHLLLRFPSSSSSPFLRRSPRRQLSPQIPTYPSSLFGPAVTTGRDCLCLSRKVGRRGNHNLIRVSSASALTPTLPLGLLSVSVCSAQASNPPPISSCLPC